MQQGNRQGARQRGKQAAEMLAPRVGLIVLFDEWNRQSLRLQSKGVIMLDSIYG